MQEQKTVLIHQFIRSDQSIFPAAVLEPQLIQGWLSIIIHKGLSSILVDVATFGKRSRVIPLCHRSQLEPPFDIINLISSAGVLPLCLHYKVQHGRHIAGERRT